MHFFPIWYPYQRWWQNSQNNVALIKEFNSTPKSRKELQQNLVEICILKLLCNNNKKEARYINKITRSSMEKFLCTFISFLQVYVLTLIWIRQTTAGNLAINDFSPCTVQPIWIYIIFLNALHTVTLCSQKASFLRYAREQL